eukprot:916385_1
MRRTLCAKANKVALFDKNIFHTIACRAAFYKFWMKLLGPSYQRYLKFPDDDNDVNGIDDIYDLESFIRKFWRQFRETSVSKVLPTRAQGWRLQWRIALQYMTTSKSRKKLSMDIYDRLKLSGKSHPTATDPFVVWLQHRACHTLALHSPKCGSISSSPETIITRD